MEVLQFRAMNTDIVLAAEGQPAHIIPGLERAKQIILTEEQRFTRFSDTSELSELNRSGGTWFKASTAMLEVIQLCQYYREVTRGFFDPTILKDLERIGYDRSMELVKAGEIGDYSPRFIRRQFRTDEILISPEDSLISLPAGMTIDLGGIAKGWIVEQAAKKLSQFSSSCAVSAGGDMQMIGLPEGQSSWLVGLEDPRMPGELLAQLNLPAGGVATSSVTKRSWKQAGIPRHHLIDPRTGEPALTDWLSVTVIAPDTCACEVYAKVLLIAGREYAQKIADEAGIDFLAVNRDGNVIGSHRSMELIHE